MQTIDDIKPEPCDKSEIHYPHGWIDEDGGHACPGVANEEEQAAFVERLKELRAKADAIQAAQSQETDTAVEHDVELVEQLRALFTRERLERHEMGAVKYGPVKYFEVDSLEEAIQEILDMANYAEYTYIKLRLLQAQLTEFEAVLKALKAARKDLVVQGPPTFANPYRKD